MIGWPPLPPSNPSRRPTAGQLPRKTQAELLTRPRFATIKHGLKLLGIASSVFALFGLIFCIESPELFPIWLGLVALGSIAPLVMALGVGGTVDAARAVQKRMLLRTRQKDRAAGLLSHTTDQEDGQVSMSKEEGALAEVDEDIK